jgi:PST family polysaccharide transporter
MGLTPRDWLETEQLREDLSRKTILGGTFTGIAQTLSGLVDVAATLVLARILTPEDFGLIAMVVAVTGLVGLFKDLGLSMATVQREDITHEQVSQLFWINTALGVLLTGITALAAPVIAWFYDEPALLNVTFALAVSFAFGGLAVQHQAILKRNLLFGRVAATSLASAALSVGVAVVLGVMDFGYWALVAKVVAAPMVLAVGTWIACGWRPAWPQRGVEVGELLKFGGNLTGFSLINYFARNLDDILIGRMFGKRTLGFYQEAYKILMVPLRQINNPIGAVAIPALSRLVDEPERYRRAYLRIVEKVLLVTMPLGAFFVGAGDWVIEIVLGDQWTEAGPYLSWLALLVFSQPISNSTGWLFISQDRTDDMFRWGLIGSGLAIASFVVGLWWGALGVAIAYSVSGLVLRTPILLWMVGRRGPVSNGDFYRVMAPFAATGLVSLGAIYGMRQLVSIERAWVGGPAALGLAAVTSLLVLVVLPSGRKALADFGELVRELKKKKDA